MGTTPKEASFHSLIPETKIDTNPDQSLGYIAIGLGIDLEWAMWKKLCYRNKALVEIWQMQQYTLLYICTSWFMKWRVKLWANIIIDRSKKILTSLVVVGPRWHPHRLGGVKGPHQNLTERHFCYRFRNDLLSRFSDQFAATADSKYKDKVQ